MKKCVLFFSLFIAVQTVPGQSTDQVTFTNTAIGLDILVEEVLARNPELDFYKAEIQAVKGERATAGTIANPEISATAGRKQVKADSLVGEGLAWSVSARQSFEWAGRVPLRKAIANRQLKLAELGYEQFRAALASKTRSLGYKLFAAQQKTAAAQEVAGRFHELREVLVQRDSAGLTPVLELRIIEANDLTMQRKASESRLIAQAALMELNQLRQQPLAQPLMIQEPQLAFRPLPDREQLSQMALTNNFELKMRQVELEQQGFKVALAKNERFPAVSVGPFYSQERAGDREQQVGIGLSIPVPLWNRNRGKITTEEARKAQAATALLVAQRTLERRVQESLQAYEARTEEIGKWRKDSIQEFQESAALADRHYRLGAVPIATYVELQKQYLEAIDALLSTKQEALEAQQSIEQLVGVTLGENALRERISAPFQP